MTREEIQQLYRDVILPEYKYPYHFEKRNDAEYHIKAFNPVCGDKYELYPTFENQVLKVIYFHGIGCALSKASTSIMAQQLEGMPVGKTIVLIKDFLEVLNGTKLYTGQDLSMQTMAELRNFEGRLDCIRLSWQALLSALQKYEKWKN